MENAGILPDFAGIVVSDRYQNYFSTRREHIAGNQACLAHLLRDYEDCAESYPGAVWPAQAQRALRGMIRAWHAALDQGLPVIPGDVLTPLEREFRHAVLAGLASVPRVPGPKNTVKQKPGRELLEFYPCNCGRAEGSTGSGRHQHASVNHDDGSQIRIICTGGRKRRARSAVAPDSAIGASSGMQDNARSLISAAVASRSTTSENASQCINMHVGNVLYSARAGCLGSLPRDVSAGARGGGCLPWRLMRCWGRVRG